VDDPAHSTPERGGWPLQLGAYAALSLAAVAPALRDPLNRVVGHPDSDIWKHLWHHWLVRDGLGEGMIGCYRIPWLAAPDGACLMDADLVNNLLVLPLSWISISLAIHAVIVVQLMGAAVAANLVARRLTGDRHAAFLAGCAYAFCCAMLLHAVASGVHERLHLALPALALWLALRFSDEGRWRDLVFLVAALALLALASPAYSVFWGLMMAALVPVDLVLPSRRGREATRGRRALRWAAVALTAVFALGAVGWLTARCVAEESHGGRGFGGDPDSLSAWPTVTDTATLAGKMETMPLECFFSPAGLDGCASRDVDFLHRFPYPGYLLLLLGLGGVLLGRTWRIRLLAALGFVLLVVSLGPALRWQATDTDYWVVHPTVWLARLVPFVHRTHIWQLVPFAQLLLAVGAAEVIAARAPVRWRRLAAVAAALLVLGETALVARGELPLPTTETRIPAVYDTLVLESGLDRDPGAIVLDLPSHAADPRIGAGRYLWYQTRHQRPVPYTINPGGFEEGPLVAHVEEGRFGQAFAAEALSRWIADGATHAVIHRRHASDEEERRAVELMEAAGAARVHADDEHLLYELAD